MSRSVRLRPTRFRRLAPPLATAGLLAAAALVMPASRAARHEAHSATYEEVAALGPRVGQPFAGVTLASDGLLYGVTFDGGRLGTGTVFRVEANGRATVVHSFASDGSEGSDIEDALTAGSDGWLYGVARAGGPGHLGVVFKVSTDGEFVVLHAFDPVENDGVGYPSASLVQEPDGRFAGVLRAGGRTQGAVYEMTPDGDVTVLHKFRDDGDGAWPQSPPVVGPDGTLYGTTSFSQGRTAGTVWSIRRGRYLRTLHVFAPEEGCQLQGGLAIADLALYGTASECGVDNAGTVWRLQGSGAFTVMHRFFSGDVLGSLPLGGLTADTEGTLYGTTFAGGHGAFGTVYAMRPNGTARTLHAFGAWHQTRDGKRPSGTVTALGPGVLVGTTQRGGGSGDGSVYRIELSR